MDVAHARKGFEPKTSRKFITISIPIKAINSRIKHTLAKVSVLLGQRAELGHIRAAEGALNANFARRFFIFLAVRHVPLPAARVEGVPARARQREADLVDLELGEAERAVVVQVLVAFFQSYLADLLRAGAC